MMDKRCGTCRKWERFGKHTGWCAEGRRFVEGVVFSPGPNPIPASIKLEFVRTAGIDGRSCPCHEPKEEGKDDSDLSIQRS